MAQHPIGMSWCDLVQEPAVVRQWRAAFAAGLITLLPLLLAVDLYIDDLERAMDGNLNWVRVGRSATAVAPLYTLVSIALLSAVGVACARAHGIRSPFWSAVSSLPLIAQPYGLQAMSYGFDSLFMALALAAAVVAALLVNLSARWPMLLTAMALELVAFNLYQPAANGFLVMSGCLCVASLLDLLDRSRPVLSLPRRLIGSAAVYCGAFGTYRLLIALFAEHRLNTYALNSAEFKAIDASLPMAQMRSAMEPLQQLVWDFGRWPVEFPLLLVVVSYAYGHAFEAQARFEQSRLSRIVGAVSVLQAARPDQQPRYLVVQGTMPRSPVLENTVRKFPLIDRLVPPLLDGDQTFSFGQLRLHGLDLQRRKTKQFGEALPTTCAPSADAICTHEFSLQRVGDDTLVLQLATDAAQERSST